MKIFAKEELGRDGFVQATAPSGTAVYPINGNALHSLLYLPVGTSTCLYLHDERLKGMQDTFCNIGSLFIDEKSMTGQKIFTMVCKGPQEAIWKSPGGGSLGGLPSTATAIQGKCH